MTHSIPRIDVDVQSRTDTRGIALHKAGILGLVLPVTIRENGVTFHSVGSFNVYTSLDKKKRGVHLSLLTQAVSDLTNKQFDESDIRLATFAAKAEAEFAEMTIKFAYFVDKTSPVSHISFPLDYQCSFCSSIQNGEYSLIKTAVVPVTTLCPDSKELSQKSAHSQRSYVTIEVKNSPLSFRDLIEVGEDAGSCEIYQVLKKMDDKFVTEKAYENPQFVEDVVRNAGVRLNNDQRVTWFRVASENMESNHNYNAFAEVIGTKED